jgi:hypothetical protein
MAENVNEPGYNFLWQRAKFGNILFSGSNISQLNNDAGYLTASGSISSSISSSYATSASYAVTASYALTAQTLLGSVTSASYALTASYAQTASYVLNAISSSYATNALNASYANTASYVNILSQQIILSGSLKLDPTQDPDPTGLDLDSTVLFQSSSNTALGYDLYVRQNGNLVKWKWIEGILETGLLYGGAVTYSGSNVYISPGSGIIADHNATTGSEISPMIEYVTWNAITQSITNIATQQVTYLYIDNTGTLQQQSTRFTSQQYHDYIPLGAVGHFDYTQVSAFGGGVQTAYDQISQISNFVDAFGPLKMSGYGLTGQAGSLRLSVGSGTSFIHGGFYQNDPEFPSQITTPSQATASLARVQRSGSAIEFDTNAGNLYTVVDPTKYDRDGDGTLANVGSGNWSIQRVFSDPKTGVLYVYYGQARYTSLLNALQFLPTDPFTEGDTFDFTTFVGFLVLKGNASDITDTAANSIINGGLFRGSGQGSGGGIALSNLEDLTDVTIVSPTNGQALVYDAGIWQNGTPGLASTASFVTASNVVGTVTSASYALTASYVQTAQTASYVLNAVSSSYALSASYATSSSFSNTAISSSYAVTASFALSGADTGSLLTTASIAGDTITFTKGNGSTFPIIIPASSDPAGWTTIVKSANQDVTNDATLTDDTDLQFSVVAGGHYMVELDLVFSANNTTGDYKNAFNVSAGNMLGKGYMIGPTATAAAQVNEYTANAVATSSTLVLGSPVANIDFLVSTKIIFSFQASANATFKYQFANNAAGAGRTSRTWKGSILKYKQID